MAITVKQALEIGGLQKGRVLAGSQHLDRVIHHVNILEAPWESFWDSQGHLFLTSFYALRNNTPLQIKNVQGLAENGCAALVFQKGVQDILDPLVIQQAEESGLPLIEVEEAISYPEIITPLVQAISREKTFLLQRSQEIHRRLTGLILSGDGLPAVVAVLHELIERPVAIINRWGDVLASMSFENSDQPQMDEDDLLQEMARSERLGLTWHKASGRWLAPLLAGEQGEIDGFVLVWDTQQEANPLDLTAIEQAATETFTVSLASRLENGEERREYLWQGQPIDLLQHLACLPDVEKKSYAAAAGPLPLTALEKEGNTSPVSHALQVGQALLSVNDNGGQGCHRRLASHFTRPVFYLCDRDGDQLVWTRPGDIRPYQNAGCR